MTANLAHAASAAGQGPGDILFAIMAVVLFVIVGGGVIGFMALRNASRR